MPEKELTAIEKMEKCAEMWEWMAQQSVKRVHGVTLLKKQWPGWEGCDDKVAVENTCFACSATVDPTAEFMNNGCPERCPLLDLWGGHCNEVGTVYYSVQIAIQCGKQEEYEKACRKIVNACRAWLRKEVKRAGNN